MMTFEDFFKRKKIDLPALQQGEPALFAEFEHHYLQMGEKSFDHTKKYWFNQLRRRFPLPPEVKAVKATPENALAEQTITDALTEPASVPAANVGFKPRFSAGATTKPAGQPAPDTSAKPAETPQPSTESTPEAAKPATGFKPRFKAAAPPKPVDETPAGNESSPVAPVEPEAPKPAVGFKPRFKAATPPKQVQEASAASELSTETSAENPTPPVNSELAPVEPVATAETPAPVPEETVSEDKPAEPTPKPVGFKPRFKAGITKPRPPEEGA